MNHIMKSLASAGFAFLLGMTAITTTAIASTPDGETPANEGVCDVLKVDGITKGLYGLCVAYCEAQDLNDMNKEPPSTRILTNYNRKKQAGDPIMPCLEPPPNCPCWTPEELDAIFADGITGQCSSSSNQTSFIDSISFSNSTFQVAQGTVDGTGSTCAFTNPPESHFYIIAEEDAIVCKAQVEYSCDHYVPTP